MGRGHSAVRSSSRLVNKQKRSRSNSMGDPKVRLAVAKEVASRAASKDPTLDARAKGVLAAKAVHAMHEAEAEAQEEEEQSEDEAERIGIPDVLTKYKMAGTLVDEVLAIVVAACVAGATTRTLCDLGDKEMKKRTTAVFRNTKGPDGMKLRRGIAFPTTVNVNNVLCHHTPFADREIVTLKHGDVIKVHLGMHIDGYPATAATTIVVGAADVAPAPAGGIDVTESIVTPAQANCVAACWAALKSIIPMMRPGGLNHDVTAVIESTVAMFPGIQLVEGVLSNRTKRWIIDASDCIISTRIFDQEPHQDVAPCEFGADQVWTLDIATTDHTSRRMQTADMMESNIYRRNQYDGLLRLTAGEKSLDIIRRDFQCFPFQARQNEEPLKLRLGLSALKKADMVDTFPVLQCKKGFVTARFSCTIAITRHRTHVLCGAPQVPPCIAAAMTPLPVLLDAHFQSCGVEEPKAKKGGKASKVEESVEEAADEAADETDRHRKRRRVA